MVRRIDAALDAADLVRQAQQGDERAFAALFGRYREAVLRAAVRALDNPDDAEDAVVEVFVRAYVGLRRLRAPGAFEVWLHRITVNVCRTVARRRSARTPEAVAGERHATGETASDPAGQVEASHLISAVREGLMHLPRIYGQVLALRYMQGLDVSRSAEVLGVPAGTVKARLARARALLARHLAARGWSVHETETNP